MQSHPLKLDYHYLRFKISPPIKDVLIIRKTITDCLVQSFGSTMASTYMDIFWVNEDGDGRECVIRAHIMYVIILNLTTLLLTPYFGGPILLVTYFFLIFFIPCGSIGMPKQSRPR